MICNACGEPIPSGVVACARCGTAAGQPAAGRTRRTEMDDDGAALPEPVAFVPQGTPPPPPPRPAVGAAPPPPSGRRRTELDDDVAPGAEARAFVPTGAQPAVAAGGRRRTQLEEDEPAPIPKAGSGRGARTIGWMISFDFNECGQEYVLREGRNTVGRSRDCDISLFYDPRASTEHSVVVCRNGQVTVRDEMSTHGTLVNGDDIGAGQVSRLQTNDVVKFGSCLFKVFLLDPNENKKIWPKVFEES